MARITVPQLVRELGVPRATIERLTWQYKDRVGEPERFGSVRTWPSSIVGTLRAVLAEEQRVRELAR